MENIENVKTVKFSDWQNLDLRTGKIISAEDVEGADKLYKLTVNLGEKLGERVLVAGLKPYYKKEELENKQCIVFTNLEPKKLRGIESQGMILAAVNEDESKVSLLQPDSETGEGEIVT